MITKQTTPNQQSGFTLIELLIVMILIGILAGKGAQIISSVSDAANTRVSIIEMRNIANTLQILVDGDIVISDTDDNIAKLNTIQTLFKLPQKNNFGKDYKYTFSGVSKTITIRSIVNAANIKPIGVLSEDVVLQPDGKTSNITIHYKSRSNQTHFGSRGWLKRWYYDANNTNLANRQTNQGDFTASYLLGNFAP